MSISQNPLTGEMRQSMANFVTTVYRGQNIIRAKAFKPRNVNSDSQKVVRVSFKMIGEECESLGGITDIGFPNRPTTYSPANAFMKANLPGAVDHTGEVPVIDYSKLVVSSGSLPTVVVFPAVVSVAGITISYQTLLTMPKVLATDEVIAFFKTQIGEVIIARQPRGVEKLGTILIAYPNIQVEDVVCCYVIVLNADGTKAAKSVYVPIN